MTTCDWNDLGAKLKAAESLITSLDGQDDYFHDASLFNARPSAILKARSTEDIVTAVLFCRERGVAITPRGAGTGLSGGCVAAPNALILSTADLKKLEIDRPKRMAICGPGVITKDLEEAASAQGLAYPPDPASWLESSLGGNVAEGAGGLRCKRYGVTKDYVLGLKAVLADGSILRTGCFNSEEGLNLGDILIASEGTLAIITEIALRLTDPIVRGTTILVAFDRPVDAAQTVSDITAAGIIPTVLEFLDGDAAACSNAYEKNEGLDNVAAILLIETSDTGQAGTIEAICRNHHSSFLRRETDPEKAETLWKVRRNLSKAVKQSAAFRISEVVAVPNSKFPSLVDWVAEENKKRAPLRLNSFGHAGDGNLHVNFLAGDDTPRTLALVENGIEALMRKTIELGGTVTGEHGIGLAKKKYLSWEFDPPTLRLMQAVKSVFDPDRMLNPDKLL
ncbi:MAG: FAD-binding protein [candidate division Zixibacteria bacterium]|nr:FAD-binding protein [candidate division Zixibacteria bacterium]